MSTPAVTVAASAARGTEASSASASSASSSSAAVPSAAAAAAKEGKLPLPDDYFKAPPLSAKERAYLIGLAKRACKEVVYYSRKDGGPMRWVHLSSEDGIELCQGVDESVADNSAGGDAAAAASSNNSLIYLRGATKIYASIDEIADFFRLDTPEKLSGFAQTVGKDIMDQRTLYTLATPTAENPKHFVAAKWTAIESPSKLARNRDFCYLECHDEFIDTNSKKRGWVRSVHSIRLPFCPRLDRSHGLVRGSLYRSGFIFLESNDKGCVDAIHTLHMDVKGNSPNWIKVLAMKRRIKNIAQVNKYFQLHRLTQGKLLGDLELPAKAGVTHCQVCESRFGLFNRKWRCRKCGKVICTPCGTSFLIDYAGAGPKKVRVCLGCSDAVVFGKLEGDAKHVVNNVKQVHDADLKPIYDPSPMSGSELELGEPRHYSTEEHDFYLENEDERGIADMMEAKRMQQEFETQLKLSAGPHSTQKGTESMSGVTLPADSPQWDPVEFDGVEDDDELGLPRSKSEQQQRRLDELRRQEQVKYEQQKELHAATQTVSYQQPNRTLTRTSSQRRSSKEEEQHMRYRFVNGSPLDQQDVLNQRIHHASQNGDHLRKDSHEVIRINSDWGSDHSPPTDLLYHHHHHSGLHPSGHSFLSATGSVRRSDLSVEGSRNSFAREHSFESASSAHNRVPRSSRAPSFASSSHETHQVYDDEDPFSRRLSSEFAASSHRSFHQAESPMLSGLRRGGPRKSRYGSGDSSEYERHSGHLSPYFGPGRADTEFEQRGTSANHEYRRDPPPRYTDVVESRSGLESTFDSSPMSSFGRRRRGVGGEMLESTASVHSPRLGYRDQSSSNGMESEMPHHRGSSLHPDTRDRDELAHYMALSAMKLFDMEHGQDMRVSDEVRQVALEKMMAVYASEIERSSTEMDRRAYSSSSRYGSTPQVVRRSASGDLSQHNSYHQRDSLRLPSDMVGGSRYERAPTLERSDTYELGYLQHKSSPALLQSRNGSRDRYQDVRDLSDLTSSAFQALQISSERTPSVHSMAQSNTERQTMHHAAAGLRRTDSFMGRPSPQQEAELRESLGSSRHSLQRDGMARPDTRSRAASGATRGSSISSNDRQRQSLLRANSVYEDAESDTFSELDFVDLPHLMRKDYVPPPPPPLTTSVSDDRGSVDSQRFRNSFTDIHQWQHHHQAQATPSSLSMDGPISRDSIFHEGVERRLSELNPDEDIFRRSHEGVARRSNELYRDSSVSSGSTRLSETSGMVPPPPSYAAAAASSEFSSEKDGSNSDSSSSYTSDGPDYTTEALTPPLPHGHGGQMTLSELERYRASLAELMSDYNRGGNDYHRLSIAESTTSSLSIGSAGFYNPPAGGQPEGEPDEQQSQRDSDSSIKPTRQSDGRLQEMYL